MTADCVYNQYTYREAAKIKQKYQWHCRWTRVQCPNGFGPRHASRPGPCFFCVCDLFVSVQVTLRAHSTLTSTIRRTRRRHWPRIFYYYLFVSVQVTLRAHSALTSAIRRTRRRHLPRILFCYLFVSVTKIQSESHCARTPHSLTLFAVSDAATGPVFFFVT